MSKISRLFHFSSLSHQFPSVLCLVSKSCDQTFKQVLAFAQCHWGNNAEDGSCEDEGIPGEDLIADSANAGSRILAGVREVSSRVQTPFILYSIGQRKSLASADPKDSRRSKVAKLEPFLKYGGLFTIRAPGVHDWSDHYLLSCLRRHMEPFCSRFSDRCPSQS